MGDVFLTMFEETEHTKFFSIVVISQVKICICSVFINSRIHPSVVNKPNIFKLYIPLLKVQNDFLSYDSFANCSYPIALEVDKITDRIMKRTCKVIGSVNKTDLEFIQNALIEFGLLSEDDITLYFF